MKLTVVRNWKRFMAVGCSHGHLADPLALEAAINFRKLWKPHKTAHLGDAWDLLAFMRGGNVDEETDINKDWEAGILFLKAYFEPFKHSERGIFFKGNHEDRVSAMCNHRNPLMKMAATKALAELNDTCRAFGCGVVEYNVMTGWRPIGDTLFGHGYMCNEMAIRDHAELVGKCVIAHLHRVGQERARRLGGATGYCVGTLADIPAMRYAKARKATTKWSMGFAYGEYCEGKNAETLVWLIEKTKIGEWKYPIMP